MGRIASLTDFSFTPSSRLRVRQYASILSKSNLILHDFPRKYSSEIVGIELNNRRIRESPYHIAESVLYEILNVVNTFVRVQKSNKFDLVWLSRQLVIGSPTFEKNIFKPLIYDIDDAVFLNSSLSRRQVKISAKKAEIVFAGNDYLADIMSNYNNNIKVIPTPIDTIKYAPIGNHAYDNKTGIFTIGWSGTSSSYKYFVKIELVLVNLIKKYKHVRIVFISDKFPYELVRLAPYITFIKWTENKEARLINKFNVGIMPIDNDDYAKGKCAYKMLLYASCGIPVVVSLVGENKTILRESEIGYGVLTESDWYSSLESLINSENLSKKLGINGRKYIEKKKSLVLWGGRVARIFNDIV